jgi:hypothetical protein
MDIFCVGKKKDTILLSTNPRFTIYKKKKEKKKKKREREKETKKKRERKRKKKNAKIKCANIYVISCLIFLTIFSVTKKKEKK